MVLFGQQAFLKKSSLLDLPVVGARGYRGRRWAISEYESHTEKTVLIVEDDEGIGSVLAEFISQETPYHALLVTGGIDALQEVKARRPDLLLLDYRLPGMNGIELYDHIQRMEGREGIPVILISATLPYQEIAQRHLVGMKKPLDLDDLLQTIEHLI